jgi:hypothetical protein
MKIHLKNGRWIDPASGTDTRQDLFMVRVRDVQFVTTLY